jgi:hypothetical protein
VAAIALPARGLLDHDGAARLQAFSDHAHPWAGLGGGNTVEVIARLVQNLA